MKITHLNFLKYLSEVIQLRLNQEEHEHNQLINLLSDIQNSRIGHVEAAERWLKIIKRRKEILLSAKDIEEEIGISRAAVNKVAYDVVGEDKPNPEINNLVGVSVAGGNVFFRDSYELWKKIRNEENPYPTGGEVDRRHALYSLSESERQYLK